MPDRLNLFNPGSGLRPPYLAGRNKELETFSKMLQRLKSGKTENMIVHGLRGVGKTVLMGEFFRICTENRFLPMTRIQYSEKYSDPVKFVDTLKYDMCTAIQTFSKLEKIKGKIHSTVSYLKPEKIGVPELLYYEPSYDFGSKMPLEDHIVDYLVKNWEVVEKADYHGVVFLFDEFHTIQNVQNNGWYTLVDFIGAVNEVQRLGYKYYAVLSGLPMLQTNIKSVRSYSERMFKSMEITNLDEDAARKAILEPLKNTDISFSEDLVSSIIKDTDRYPYFIQFYSQEIIDHVDKNNIGLDDYVSMKDLIISEIGKDFFEPRMTPLSDSQKNVLYCMADMQNTDITFSYLKVSSDGGKGPLSNHLKRLEEKGLIYKYKRGIYRFSMPLFKEYLLTLIKSGKV